ncbi:MAG: protein kinase [Archangium sp.]|nr:protein kinase [Archangium sp.]
MSPPNDEAGAELDPTRIRDPLLGTSVLGYVLRRRIGVGGMGVVYEAEEPNIGRRAAVKVLLPEFADQPQLVERLKSEARAANAAKHRGIIDVFGFGATPDGRHSIVMEFLEGTPLDVFLAQTLAEGRRVPVLTALEVISEVAAALEAAHRAGVTHRDLKPSNIFLSAQSDGTRAVKVLDFGIAKVDGLKNGPHTAAHSVLGTPAYMSPEQAHGEAAAPSMDLYSLGIVAFELLTGRPPFVHETLTRMLLAHQNEAPPKPSALAPGLPAMVDAFVLRLLAKRPVDRPPDAAAVRSEIAALRKVLADPDAITTAPDLPAAARLPTERIEVPRSRTPLIVVLSLLVVAGVVGVVMTSTEGTMAPDARPPEPTPPQDARPIEPTPVQPTPIEPTPVEPTPVEPTPVEPTPVEATPVEPRPVEAAADAGAAAKTKVTGPDSVRKSLRARLKKLEKRISRAKARGDTVTVFEQQLSALESALKGASTPAKLDSIDTALTRLEAEVP